jgi:hypothetical protein
MLIDSGRDQLHRCPVRFGLSTLLFFMAEQRNIVVIAGFRTVIWRFSS